MTDWGLLRQEFRRLADAGHPVRLWLRDDDAVRVTPALERLADIARQAEISAVLAVIPEPAEGELGAWALAQPQLAAAVHGYAHRNHAPVGEKRQEFGPHRPLEAMKAELASGRERIATLFGARALSMLVPPWNRIALALIPELPSLGFRSLSAFGPESLYPQVPGLRIVNTHLDLIDWRGTRQSRPHEDLVGELLSLLRQQETAQSGPLGVVTHHLAHDEDAWTFLERLIETADGLVRWASPD